MPLHILGAAYHRNDTIQDDILSSYRIPHLILVHRESLITDTRSSSLSVLFTLDAPTIISSRGIQEGQLLVELQLRLEQLRQRDHHQQILHIRVEHLHELLLRHVRHRVDQIQQRSTHRVVRKLFARQHIVHVRQDLVQQTDELVGSLCHLLDLDHGGDGLRFPATGRLNGLGAQLQAHHLRLVRGHVHIDRGEHAALLAIRHSQADADKCLQAHPASLQRRVHGDVHGVVALARIILVNDRAVVRHLVTRGPPS